MNPKIKQAPHRLLVRLSRLWKRRFGVLPMGAAVDDLSGWFETPLGRALLQEQQQTIDDALQCMFGYYLVQLGVSAHLDLSVESRISQRFVLHPKSDLSPREAGCVGALSDFNHLPLASETIDTVLLHHALDYSQSPHHLLREATRVIIPRGHLILVGFNPWSLWGFCSRLLRLFSTKPRWRFQYLRKGRLLDWLTLVDMEPVAVYDGFYRPPLPHPGAIKYLQWLERWGKRLRLPWGGFYVIVACKDRIPLTPVKPAWQPRAPLPGLAVTRILGSVSNKRLGKGLLINN